MTAPPVDVGWHDVEPLLVAGLSVDEIAEQLAPADAEVDAVALTVETLVHLNKASTSPLERSRMIAAAVRTSPDLTSLQLARILTERPAFAGADLTELVAKIDRLRPDQRRNGSTAAAPIALPPDLDEFLAGDDPPYEWVVPGVIESGDRVILTGEEGRGKSTLLRQIAIQCAAGVHPFTLDDLDPVPVLFIDCENSVRQVRRKIRPLREIVGDRYRPGSLHVEVVGHSLELARADVWTRVAGIVGALEPRLIVIGPLYKMAAGDPTKEEPARELADALDALRALCGSALLIEAHSPYAEGSKSKRPTRPYGASLWSRWPEFGLYLAPDGGIEHWRGPRDEREWPARLTRSTPWPWSPVTPTDAPPAWDGPTHCMDAIVAYLDAHPDEQISKSAMPAKLRTLGANYRDRTVTDSLEILAQQGRIHHTKGPRNADLYRSLPADQEVDREMF